MFKGLARLLIKMSVFLNSPGYGMNLLNLPLLDKDIVDGNRSFLINCIFVVTLILQLIKIGPQYAPRIPPPPQCFFACAIPSWLCILYCYYHHICSWKQSDSLLPRRCLDLKRLNFKRNTTLEYKQHSFIIFDKADKYILYILSSYIR